MGDLKLQKGAKFVRSLYCDQCKKFHKPNPKNSILFYKDGSFSAYKPGSFKVKEKYIGTAISPQLIEIVTVNEEANEVTFTTRCLMNGCGVFIKKAAWFDQGKTLDRLTEIRDIIKYGFDEINEKLNENAKHGDKEGFGIKEYAIIRRNFTEMYDFFEDLNSFIKLNFVWLEHRKKKLTTSIEDFKALHKYYKERPIDFYEPTLV